MLCRKARPQKPRRGERNNFTKPVIWPQRRSQNCALIIKLSCHNSCTDEILYEATYECLIIFKLEYPAMACTISMAFRGILHSQNLRVVRLGFVKESALFQKARFSFHNWLP